MAAPLPADRLRKLFDPSRLSFKTTEELQSDPGIIGQPRGVRGIHFGIHMASPGYNIYVLGESGTGRTTAIKKFIEEKAAADPIPEDIVYVFNFAEPRKPAPVSLPAGMGNVLRSHIDRALEHLRNEIPKAFENEVFRDAALEIQHQQQEKRESAFNALQAQAAERGAAVISTPEGMQIIPVQNGKPVSPQQYAQFSEEEEAQWRETQHTLEHLLNDAMFEMSVLERAAQDEVSKLVSQVAGSVIDSAMAELIGEYEAYDEIVAFLTAMQSDILENINLFRNGEQEETRPHQMQELLLRRYRVNVVVDHTASERAPVIVEYNPTLPRLLGRIEHETRAGGVTLTDFTLIRSGALHEANGGYLVLRARDLFAESGSWDALKRALIGGEVKPDDPAIRGGSPIGSLDPEPVLLDLKVILIGPPQLYYALYENDEDFRTIFKVMADFDEQMDRNFENESEYARFVARLCEEEGLLPFDRSAVARVIEYGSRIAGSQKQLTTRFGKVADLVREANFWAWQENRGQVAAEDVLRSEEEREFRSNRIETRIRENVQLGKQLIASDGEVVGQVNGLYVSIVGEQSFGQPARVTARTYAGKAGVVQIDREVELAGRIHNKGLLTLTGYLGGTYAQEAPLSFSALITFEQNYQGMDGDSASSTELYALISSLADVPIRQAIAVTGSVNQLGIVQAIGGVTQKVEGWFELCRERGLTGDQGVVIPAVNIDDLMVRVSVQQAVEDGLFHVWAIETIDEGLELLTGVPAEETHQKAAQRMRKLAQAVERDS